MEGLRAKEAFITGEMLPQVTLANYYDLTWKNQYGNCTTANLYLIACFPLELVLLVVKAE